MTEQQRSAPRLGQTLYVSYSTSPELYFIQVHLDRCQVVSVGPEYFVIVRSGDMNESHSNCWKLRFNVSDWRAIEDPERFVLYENKTEFAAEWEKTVLDNTRHDIKITKNNITITKETHD